LSAPIANFKPDMPYDSQLFSLMQTTGSIPTKSRDIQLFPLRMPSSVVVRSNVLDIGPGYTIVLKETLESQRWYTYCREKGKEAQD
jgi:hypothetical protein